MVEQKKEKTFSKAVIYGLLPLILLTIAFCWGSYVFFVGSVISDKGSDWADFGSYFGGVLGPFFSAASILFVWWQSHNAIQSQQDQLNKLNEQLGLEKQIIFRGEFVRLLTKAIEQGEKKIVAGHVGCFKGQLGATECSYKKLIRSVKHDSLRFDQKISDDNLNIVWKILQPYLVSIFELADLLNKSSQFNISNNELVVYIRQFRFEFYTVRSEIGAANQLLFIDEILTKPDIHGYEGISIIFKEPEA